MLSLEGMLKRGVMGHNRCASSWWIACCAEIFLISCCEARCILPWNPATCSLTCRMISETVSFCWQKAFVPPRHFHAWFLRQVKEYQDLRMTARLVEGVKGQLQHHRLHPCPHNRSRCNRHRRRGNADGLRQSWFQRTSPEPAILQVHHLIQAARRVWVLRLAQTHVRTAAPMPRVVAQRPVCWWKTAWLLPRVVGGVCPRLHRPDRA